MEAALALCSLALVTALAIGAVAAVVASVRCVDAARELARLAARGEPDRGRAVAAELAPPGARITLTTAGDELRVEVSAAPVAVLPVRVGGRAVAVLEPGVIGAGTAGGGAATGSGLGPGPGPPSGTAGSTANGGATDGSAAGGAGDGVGDADDGVGDADDGVGDADDGVGDAGDGR